MTTLTNHTGAPAQDAAKWAKSLSPGYLAFLGDAVYSLMARERIIRTGGSPGRAHSLAAGQVCATAQARAAALLEPLFTAEEAEQFRRGRNAQIHQPPKGTTCADYHAATGLEALFGFLYLCGRQERLNELLDIVWAHPGEKSAT